jgi:predicted Zn-dependent peptidase
MEASATPGVAAEIRSVTLDNGLRIIVWPDHDIPNVALYYFVRAGGATSTRASPACRTSSST